MSYDKDRGQCTYCNIYMTQEEFGTHDCPRYNDFKEAKRIICESTIPVSPVFLHPRTSMKCRIEDCGGYCKIILLEEVSREEYQRLAESARLEGGWHARGAKGEPGGFCFTRRLLAEAWADEEGLEQ